MTKQSLRLTLFLLICLSIPLTVTAQIVDIPDPNLRAAIEDELGKAPGAAITVVEMATLTDLRAPNANISDLTGLEAATNLTWLHLGVEIVEKQHINSNSIADLSPLVGLTNLTRLWLWNNAISDISPLAGLTNLELLDLGNNLITDISPLTGLTNLTILGLHNNNITNVTAIAGLTNLTLLWLWNNTISDILPIAGLTNLESLDLANNSISNISPLAGLTNLTQLWLEKNAISDISPIAGLTNLTVLELSDNNISDIAPLVINKGLRHEDEVILWGNPLNALSINTHIPTLKSRGVAVYFHNINVRPEDIAQTVDIPDPNLRAVIESELRKAQGTTITVADMLTLTDLYAARDNISDLTGLEAATNLGELDLRDNNISDISALAGLTNLIELDLADNNISDISALAGLTQLYELNLQNNSISDLSPLVANIGLGIDDSIDVRGNFLNATSINTHIPILEGREIRVSFHDIVVRPEDIAQTVDIPDPKLHAQIAYERGKMPSDPITMADMLVLVDLRAYDSNIRDLTGLEHATNLTTLWLERNSVSDLSPLAGLTNLEDLNLRSNDVFDLSPLVANTGLGAGDHVNVKGNPLNVQSIISHIPTLQSRGVFVRFTNIVVRPEDIAKIVNIPDPNFRTAIEEKLGISSGEPITVADMRTLVYLYIDTHDLSDLTGIEHATNLRKLSLWGNRISDISPLAGLTDLWALQLYSNSITDISPLAELTNLTELWLSNNSISDISPIAGLTNLELLFLGNNSITDISPIAGLNELGQLRLYSNSISDISPLAGLTQLNWLRLEGNNITDISPIAGLNELWHLQLSNNSISDISPLAGLNELWRLWLGNNSISDISPITGLNELKELQIENNSISDLSPLVENTGLGHGDLVNVRRNFLNALAINTHIPALQSRGVTVEFDNVVVRPEDIAQTVDIPDPNLRAAIADARSKPQGVSITMADMLTLTELLAPNANISDLTGLEAATNLTRLYLGDEIVEEQLINSNSISDLSPLAGLTNLTGLWLQDNSISDISTIAGLTNLTELWLHNNSIADISAVAGLVNLTELVLQDNSISDISAIAGLTNLAELWLDSNSISDISAVARLTNLTELVLQDNSISDIAAIAGLTNLTELWLNGNSISDISAVAGLGNLIILSLWNNSIADISAVEELTNLTELWLSDNFISDISAIAGLTDLTSLGLAENTVLDLSPLVANTGFGSEDFVDVTGNPLSDLSINTHIPALQSRGVEVYFDDTAAQPADINSDGVINIFDLVSIASQLGKQGQDLAADVNGDGVVDVRDLVLVAGMFDAAAAAPSVQPEPSEMFTAASVRGWLTDAKALEINDLIMERGIMVLEQLLASLTPTETQLLANYPNPFNPETWIPYRLAKDAFVTLTIYNQTGQVVRTIDVGLQAASAYESRSGAIYWDGRNEIGEQVASGVYFYHLSAGDYSATRKMLILK